MKRVQSRARPKATRLLERTRLDDATRRRNERVSLFLPVHLTDAWQAREQLLLGSQALAEHHEQSSDHGQVPEEEREVEDEAVTERLSDDDSKETSDGVLGVSLCNDEE